MRKSFTTTVQICIYLVCSGTTHVLLTLPERREKTSFVITWNKQDRLRFLQFAVRLLLQASPAVISAIIFNIAQSDSYTFMVHSNAYSTLYTVQGSEHHNKQWLCLSGGVWESPPCNNWRNTTSAGLVICAVAHVLPQSHTLLFSMILSAASASMTVFAALKRTLFYDRLELWFDWWSSGQIWLCASEGGVLERWQAAWWVKMLPWPSNEREIRKSPITLSVMSHTCTLL